jgi:hypothetical protein
MPNRFHRLALLALLVVPVAGQAQKEAKPRVPAMGLSTAALAGQAVAVLPLSMVVSDPAIPGGTGPRARAAAIRWADSLLGEALEERATEVKWLLPPALRRIAQRSGGLVPSPDQMGQSVMRSPRLKDAPEPLRTYIRQLVALAGGARFAMVPAALYLSPAPGDSLTVQLAAVLVDARLGRVVWRTLAVGRGETATDAFRAALETIIPSDTPPPSP